MMRSESSNYKLGRLDKVLVLKFALKPTDRPVNPDTEFKMVRGRTIKIGCYWESVIFLKSPKTALLITQEPNIAQRSFFLNGRQDILYHLIYGTS